MFTSNKAIAKELRKRKQRIALHFKLEDHLFSQQLTFVNDPTPTKVAVCSRRAGKSTAVAADLVNTAFTTPECTALYITGTRSDAKKIIWAEILKFNRKYQLGGVPNISELTLSFPNGSIVRLAGAKDEQEVDKIRGQLPPVKKAFIDEAQSIRDHVLKKLIDDVLEASLLDYAGSLIILGTPGAIPTGYFYRVAHNLDEHNQPLKEKVWSNHGWTFFDNPFMASKAKMTHQQLLDRVYRRRGVTAEDPSIQREYFGKWTTDSDSLLIHYNPGINHYTSLDKAKYSYVMGIDLGFDDADAISVLAWAEHDPTTYLVEEVVVPQQGITELVKQIEDLRLKYDVSKMVIDQGGLGKKIAEEMRRRHAIPVEAADKARKMENVAFLNDALRTGKFKALTSSKFAQDSYLVEIDKEKSTPDKTVVSKRYHSDIIDAVLYSFKLSPAYAFVAPVPKAKPGTKEYNQEQETEMFEATMRGLKDAQDSFSY